MQEQPDIIALTMSRNERIRIVGLTFEKAHDDALKPTHNVLLLETVIDEQTGVSYPIYVQPYEEWNEYGVLDQSEDGRSLLEIYSFYDPDDETPSIQAWWQSTISPEEYLRAADRLYDHMEGPTGHTTRGSILICGPVSHFKGMDYVHTSRFDLHRPFSIEEARALQQLSSEGYDPTVPVDYGWPFSFDQATYIGLYALQFGEVRYDRQNGVIGLTVGSSVYKGNTEVFLHGMEQYCLDAHAVFPPGVFSKVFDHVLHDPNQVTEDDRKHVT